MVVPVRGDGVGRIVVGVDDSPGSLVALRWAIDEARLRSAELDVVHVYASTHGLAAQETTYHYPDRSFDEDTASRRLTDRILDQVADDLDGLRPRCRMIPDAQPAKALVEAAEGADLLVVGSRGRGGFRGLLLGSVSLQCVHVASCPVAVIRAPSSAP